MKRQFLNTLLVAVAIAGISLAVLVLIVPRSLGYRAYVITGGSMDGTISRGALIYTQPVAVESLVEGDIVTFVPPGMEAPVTHRIVDVRRNDAGELEMQTRGDNVGMRDPWVFVPRTPMLPRFVLAIPYVGYVIAVLSLPLVRILVFVLPAMVIALVVLVRLWRRAGAELRESAAPTAPRPGAATK